ncbi:hypothetical protein M0E84_10745 [Corynebacterium sp. CCM 9186]|uniref:hypothetical protein n=1 Tax=Corynebacterium meridianum TaxID=2765363 RepID=UPI002003F8B7|nr:hypothetical protein [Corynebacterium meridianum]MCK7678501.1 hypothetical protein [Corynebacterium meridianum]
MKEQVANMLGVAARAVSGSTAVLDLKRQYHLVQSMVRKGLPDSVETQTGPVPIRLVDAIAKSVKLEPSTKLIRLDFEVVSSDASVPRAAIFRIEFRGADNNRLLMTNWSSNNETLGDYYYLNAGPIVSPDYNTVYLEVPDEARVLLIVGQTWKSGIDVGIVGDLLISTSPESRIGALLQSGTPMRFSADQYSDTIQIAPSTSRIKLEIPIEAGEVAGEYPFSVKVFGNDRKKLAPLSGIMQHSNYGPIFTVSTKRKPDQPETVSIDIPSGVKTVEITGLPWGKKTGILSGPIKLIEAESGRDEIAQFIRSLGREVPLMVIDSTAPPLGHDTLALRPNNLAYAYSKLGIAVVFIPFGSLQGFDAAVSERIYQIDRNSKDLLIGALLQYRQGMENFYICSSFPSFEALCMANVLKAADWKIIYECRDDMEEFNRVGYSKWYLPTLERAMLRNAHCNLAVSKHLADKLQELNGAPIEIVVSPNAVNQSVIDLGAHLRSLAVERERLSCRTVGYVGHLTDSWFDWKLVCGAATMRPEINFQIVGHGLPDGIVLPKNVEYLGPKSHAELPEIVRHWKAGLIPFKDLPLTRAVDPNKIYEYFAWGLYCLTAEMGNVSNYPSTYVYSDLDSFLGSLDEIIGIAPRNEEQVTRMEHFLEECSWEKRAQECWSLYQRMNGEDSNCVT